jgi:hypothetical protein
MFKFFLEPREFSRVTKQNLETLSIPVDMKQRKDYLGTKFGVLMYELAHCPDATLAPILRLCIQVPLVF